ncbi:hypothetical protein H4Q26_002708 [Puccinia striiformis f. sp. tritici PST-130]|nr:hypothetical protein H4Q26_002708 [Puccinia striiformis f. sp. tritici PST-130]
MPDPGTPVKSIKYFGNELSITTTSPHEFDNLSSREYSQEHCPDASRYHLIMARAPVILGKYQKVDYNGSNSGSSTATMDNRKQMQDRMPKGSKLLILNGHKGIGRMIVQLMRYFRPSRDLWVSVHVPSTATGNLVELEELVEQLEEEGATEVITSDSVLGLLHGQHESSFDVVLDTIGGQRIYDGSRRLLHHSGMFVTTIGPDSTTSMSRSRFFRLRSLKRHFFKKDSKRIRYWQVTPADGFDGADPQEIRTILETISKWLSETEEPQEHLWDDFNFPGVCWPVIGNVVEGLDQSLGIFQESLAVMRASSNLIPGVPQFSVLAGRLYEESRHLKFGSVAVVTMINYDK